MEKEGGGEEREEEISNSAYLLG